MTSPNQPKPDNTSSVYDDVYAVGSSFGQDLRRENDEATEAAVRDLLMNQGKSPFENALGQVIEFFDNLLSGIVEGIKGLLGGAVELGTELWNSAVSAVGDFIRSIFDAIGNLFGIRRGEPAKPLPPVYNEIKTDIEAATQPMLDAVDEARDNANAALEAAGDANQLVVDEIARVDTAIAAADSAAQSAGTAAAEAADAASQAFQKAESALTSAGEANSTAQALNTTVSEMNTRIEGLEGEFGEYSNTQDQIIQELPLFGEALGDLQDDYVDMNNRLWGAQGELNRINNALWDTQTGWNASQEKINNALTAANAAQDEAIEALGTATKLAFPEYNLVALRGSGFPDWSAGGSDYTTTSNLPSAATSGRYQWFSSNFIMYANLTAAPGMRYLRVSFWHSADSSSTSARLRITSGNNSNYLSVRWRDTFPKNPEDAASEELHGGWTTSTDPGTGTYTDADRDPVTGWVRKDIVIELPNNYSSGRLYLIPGNSGRSILDFRAVAYYPGQAATDLAQNRALHNIRTTLDGLSKASMALETVQEEHGESIDSLAEAMAKLRSYIPRLMIVPDASYGAPSSKPYLRDDYVQVRYDSTTSLLVDARGSTWAGKIVVTAYYRAESYDGTQKTQIRYYTFDIKDTGRTNGIPRKPQVGLVLDSVRIDYYVEPGSLQVDKVTKDWSSSPYVAPQDPSWYEQTTDNFVFTANTKEEVPHNVVYKVGWHSAARDRAVYRIRVRKVSAEGNVTSWPQERVLLGPLFPWEDGYREMSITTSIPMKEGDKLYFGFSVGTTGGTVTSDQRRVRNQERKVSWVAQSN